MKVSIGVGVANDDWAQTTAYVTESEKVGVDMVWSAENWGHDCVSPLAYLAGKTERMRLGTGIMQAPARTPAAMAMSAMSLAAMSGDRFTLGLGASGPQVVEGWHGVPFNPSIQRVREAIQVIRTIARGERSLFEGKVYHLPLPGGEGKALKTNAQPRQFPIFVAALSPKSLEMTGELADGWIGTSFIPEHADVFFAHMARGAEKAGRKFSDLEIAAPAGALAITDDVGRVLRARKKTLAFQLGAMGSRQHNFYNDAYRRAGYDEEAKEVQRLYLDGKHEEAAAMVPDDMAMLSSMIGTRAMVKERVQAFRGAGVHILQIAGLPGPLEQKIAMLAQLVEIVKEVDAEAAVPA